MKKLITLLALTLTTTTWAEDNQTTADDTSGQTLAQQLNITKTGDTNTDWIADVATRIKLHGYAQGWYTAQHTNGKNNNTFLCKRTLFWANAQITDRWSFLFMHDFNSVVQEYYTDLRITNNNLLNLRLGQAKTGLTYENPLSPTSVELIDVYSEGVTYLTGCGSDPLNGVQYGRDQGLFIYGETNNKQLRYEIDITNGSGINVKDNNNQKNIIGRIELRPTPQLNLCLTGQIGRGTALTDSTILNPTITKNQRYTRNRLTAGFSYKTRPFSIHGEYLQGKDGNVTSRGAYITGSIALVPNKTWEIVGSYDYFNYNTDIAADMHKAVAGIQYWFFKQCRFQLQYIYKNADTDYKTYFRHGANHQLMCQMQIRFN